LLLFKITYVFFSFLLVFNFSSTLLFLLFDTQVPYTLFKSKTALKLGWNIKKCIYFLVQYLFIVIFNIHTSVKKNLYIFPLLSYVGLLISSTPFLNIITVGSCRLKDESLILYLAAASGYRLISILPNLRYLVSYLK